MSSRLNKQDVLSGTITTRLATPFYTEGPGLDEAGNVYFTTITGGRIMKLAPGGAPEEWATGGYPNGQRILSNSDHLVCDSKTGEVVRFDPDGQRIKAEAKGVIAGLPINQPNDLAIDEDHGFYFTDSTRHDGKVFYVGFDGKQKVVAQRLDYPNGIVLTPDRDVLLVAESYQNRILLIRLSEVGVAQGKPEVLIDLPRNNAPYDPENVAKTGNLPDGLALDRAGNLWVAHYGMQALQVISPSGKRIASIDTGIPATSNLCFSTPDAEQVIVTGGTKEPGPGLVHTLTIERMKDSTIK